MREVGGLWHHPEGMAAGSKDESFRIADRRRPEVRGSRARPVEPPPARPSVGFPAVEAELDTSTIEEVVARLRPRYERLEALAARGSLRDKAAAKRAILAYERAADLFEHLFATKDGLLDGAREKPST